jgi:hypothetical protein
MIKLQLYFWREEGKDGGRREEREEKEVGTPL